MADGSVEHDGYVVSLYEQDDERWSKCECDLQDAGVTLPLVHRQLWAQTIGSRHWLVSAADRTGTCRAAIAVETRPTRAMPGHVVLRSERVGATNAPWPALRAALVGLRKLAAERPRVLRLEVALFARDAARRAALGKELEALGCCRAVAAQSYVTTSTIDLTPTEEELLASFHGTARRHIRAVAKRPVTLRPIEDERLAPAMHALIVETRRRTGGAVPHRPIDAWIELARRRPEWLRIMGVFADEDDELVAFSCGQLHGDHVVYSDAASVRRDALKLPLGYAPAWELMRWGKSVGARWFDFGGITEGSHHDAEDALGGISDFKRYFKGAIEQVGEEWYVDARPRRALVARAVHEAATTLRGMRSRLWGASTMYATSWVDPKA